MNITNTWRSAQLPVDLDALKLDLRVDSDDEDGTLERMAFTAADLIERRSGQVIVPGEFLVGLECFPPCGSQFKIDRGPLREILGLQYVDADKAWQDVSLDDFWVDQGVDWFSVQPLSTFTRPSLLAVQYPVRLRFVAGYDVDDSQVSGEDHPLPAALKGVFVALTGHYYANRELFAADKLTEIESTAGGLLNAIRKFW